MYTLTISCNELISAVCGHHKVVNKSAIKKAYSYAEEKHLNQKGKMGEPYIMHPLRVARFIADWGFDSTVVIAALLHDVVEECNISLLEIEDLFGSSVSKLVDTLTSVNKNLDEYKDLEKLEIDNLSAQHFLQNVGEESLFIKIADRLDNLYTISGAETIEKLNEAQNTREILIPLVQRVGAFQLADELKELCFRVEHEEKYMQIKEKYKLLCSESCISTYKNIEMLKNLFLNTNNLLPRELEVYQKYILKFYPLERSASDIFEVISYKSSNLQTEFISLLNKNIIALHDLDLIVDDELITNEAMCSPIDLFFKYYETVLLGKGFCIDGFKKTLNNNSDFILLSDDMGNKYRLFIRTEEEYMHYCFGQIVDTTNELSFADVTEVDPRDAYKEKIKVFKRDGSELFIDAGATVLDFAYAIHSEVGLHFDYALIDGSKEQFAAHKRLNQGDQVEIITSENIKATLQWFNYLKTSKGVHHLTKYIQTNYEKKKD